MAEPNEPDEEVRKKVIYEHVASSGTSRTCADPGWVYLHAHPSLMLQFAFIFAVASQFDARAAERFANLALACVHKEYPNKISHSLNSDADVAPPRKLTPAFYGCYDWHSSVHGHWLLARLARTFPDATFTAQARQALKESLTADNIAQEAAYLRAEGRSSFERPYGLAWLLQLGAELRESDPELAANLHPL